MSDRTSTVLVVDDEANNRNVIVAQLKNEGYQIKTAASGEEALDIIDRERPDLILLDVMMPGISGFDVAEILKNEQRTANIPIIMLTSLGDVSSRLTALNNGAEEFLTKPVGRAELAARIRNLLKIKNHQDDLSRYSSLLEGQVAERTSALETVNLQLDETYSQLLQAEKLAALGQLAAGVAHEINNPIGFVNSNLGTLSGYLKDLLRIVEAYEAVSATQPGKTKEHDELQALKAELDLDFLRSDAPQLIAESLDGISRVRNIVKDLKNFAHVDASPEWAPANLHECLDSTLNIANHEIKYKATVVKDYGALPDVECLPSQLNQVFLNLLVNAAQAIPENGQGTITVRTAADGDNVRIEISDTGCGIAPENIQKIFDPFFTTKPVGTGTGLGLSLSYGIIQRHHGRIEVGSEVGRGTTFRITLPIRHPATPAD
jgi:signal transduction histidine kinase